MDYSANHFIDLAKNFFSKTRWDRTLKLVRGYPDPVSDHVTSVRPDSGRRPGTRFWPRSRRGHAKQVLHFFGDRSLIQQTVDRLRPVLPPERIWILTNDHLRAEIVRQLPEVPKRQILAEPAQRNTAPAIGLAAHILQSIDPDAVMGVFPADHVIGKPREYVRLLRPAFKAAAQGKIVVLGIQPRWPETGYGYIEFPKAFSPAAPSRCVELSRKARCSDRGAVSQGREFLLERGHVLLEDVGAARRPAPVSAQDRDSAGQPACVFEPPSSPRSWPKRFHAARTFRSTTRCWNARRTSSAFRRAISAGTTSEAGTPSMSCTRATRTAMRCARDALHRDQQRQLRRRAKASWSRCWA